MDHIGIPWITKGENASDDLKDFSKKSWLKKILKSMQATGHSELGDKKSQIRWFQRNPLQSTLQSS